MAKYMIFDFGKVLGYPKTGKWFITPKFLELTNVDINSEELKNTINKYKYLVQDNLPIKTLEDEYNMFNEFYSNVLEELHLDKELASEIAHDKVYGLNEYELYDDVKKVLNDLKEDYKLIMLTDNFPSIIDYLKKEEIYDLFDKVYVSSICESSKKEDKFFEIMIKEFDINDGTFIDDSEGNLDMGVKFNLEPIMIDRDDKKESKYKKISSLNELEWENERRIHIGNRVIM